MAETWTAVRYDAEDEPAFVIEGREHGIVAEIPTFGGEAEAHARLIAAAPELLEALKKIHFLANNATRDDILLIARAAIAKADR